jgi:hypothetical protein
MIGSMLAGGDSIDDVAILRSGATAITTALNKIHAIPQRC